MGPTKAATGSRPRTVAIVGAGAVGLSCAVHLLRAGFSVELFDPEEPGQGCSAGNAGVIATPEVLPFGRPSILRQVPRMLLDPLGPLVIRWGYLPRLLPWLVRFAAACRPAELERISAALVAIMADAVEAWREILRGSGGEALLSPQGWLRLYGTRAALAAAMPEADWRRSLGVNVEILNAGQVRDLEPALAPAFEGAVFYPGVYHALSPGRITRVLASLVLRDGGVIHRRKIQRLEMRSGRPTLVDDSGRRIGFDRIVVAAGAWSRRLIRTIGIDAALDTERGYHVMLPSPAATLRRPTSVMSPGYSLIQMEEGLRLVTTVEFAGLDAPPDFRRVRRLAAHAATVLPGLKSEPVSEWLGFRPSTPTSLPVIGPSRKCPEVLLAFGHGHLGLTLAPMTGRLIADLVEERRPAIDMAPFLPRR